MKGTIRPYPILIPEERLDGAKWAVVACDQFTSEPQYWEELDRFVGSAPSTLRMILPEALLGDGETTRRIEDADRAMDSYLDRGLFRTVEGGMILTRRTTGYGRVRTGIVTSVDLEAYSYRAEDRAAIRATEGTVLERIPPRVKIRENAKLELPHVMMLIDDELDRVMRSVRRGVELYAFDLNMDGGRLEGWAVENPDEVAAAYEALLRPVEQVEKYGSNAGLLMAVGDGNHSLATAKTCWDKIKETLSEEERERHPARFALVEIVNIYDEGIQFEPIHRAVFGDVGELVKTILRESSATNTVGTIVTKAGDCLYPQPDSCAAAVAGIDRILETYAHTHEIRVDYVHGEESVRELAAKGAVGILLPHLPKAELFRIVARGGVLPRKTFSMGEAREKRYYYECKPIRL